MVCLIDRKWIFTTGHSETTVRVMAVIDTYRVSGPAKGLLDFFEFARDHLDPLVVVFERGRGYATELQSECARRSLAFAAVWERHRNDQIGRAHV